MERGILNGASYLDFFENGNPNRPYYLGGLNLQNTKILPECQVGNNPHKKWVIYKSNSGRTIVISDDPDDERVEITGKKRQLSSIIIEEFLFIFIVFSSSKTFELLLLIGTIAIVSLFIS